MRRIPPWTRFPRPASVPALLIAVITLAAAGWTRGQPSTALDSAPAAIQSLERPPADMAGALRTLADDLATERVTGFDGRTTTLLDKFRSLPEGVLGPAQKGRIMSILAEIHQMNLGLEAGIPPGAPGKGYQMVNWQHTRTEVNEVLDAMLKFNARAARGGGPLLTPAQIEDAIVAAAFSDSVKLPPGKTGNFFRHHIDGAEAARQALARHYRGDPARIQGIVRAIHEHQIVPPNFMGNLTRHALVGKQRGELIAAFRNTFPDELVGGEPNFQSRNGRVLKGVLDAVDRATGTDPARRAALALADDQAALLRTLGSSSDDLAGWSRAVNGARDRIARPLTQPLTPDGSRIAFTTAEQRALRGIGIDDWFVPVRGAPHAPISEFVRVGDTAANYMSSPAGTAKIVAIRGPGTPFADHTVWDSIRSAQQSYRDALSVIPDEHRPILDEMRRRNLQAIRETGREVRTWANENKARFGYAADEPVLFLDRTASTRGLTPEQLTARETFAREIRSRMESGLRAKQDSWANVGRAPYDVDDLATRMANQTDDAARLASRSGRATGARTAAAAEPTLLGVRSATVKGVAGQLGKGTAIGVGLGIGIEAARELITDGRVDGSELWGNTLGNIQNFWKPLLGGTAGALAAGALAARLIPGGGLVTTGLQFLGGSLGATAATGDLARNPGRSAAGAIGSGAGAVLGGAALSWLLPPLGPAVGSLAGGIAGQVAGEWLYESLAPRRTASRAAPAGAALRSAS